MDFYPNDCKYGDVIRVKLGLIYHYGIFISEDEVIQFGLPPIEKNKDKQNPIVVCTTPIGEFACGNFIEVASYNEQEKKIRYSNDEIASRARSRIGESGYSLLHNNCEHFVYECALGIKKSTQEDKAKERWNKRPITDVYIINKDFIIKDYDFKNEQLLSYLKKQNKDTANLKYFLLDTAIKKSLHYNLFETNFKKSITNKITCKEFGFNFSFCNDYLAIVISNIDKNISISFEQNTKNSDLSFNITNINKDVNLTNANNKTIKFYEIGNEATTQMNASINNK